MDLKLLGMLQNPDAHANMSRHSVGRVQRGTAALNFGLCRDRYVSGKRFRRCQLTSRICPGRGDLCRIGWQRKMVWVLRITTSMDVENKMQNQERKDMLLEEILWRRERTVRELIHRHRKLFQKKKPWKDLQNRRYLRNNWYKWTLRHTAAKDT